MLKFSYSTLILLLFVFCSCGGGSGGGADNIHRVTFDDGINIPIYIDVENDATLVWPEEPTRDSYSFVGWRHAGHTYKTGDLFIVTTDTVFSAIWETEALFHTVTFMNEGIEYAQYSSLHGQNVIWTASPTRAGYNFAGWTLDGIIFNLVPYPVVRDLVFVATWIKIDVNKHTVAVILNGGTTTDTLPATTVEHGTEITLPTVVREGYEFSGWLLNGTNFNGASYVVTGNAIFSALWETKLPPTKMHTVKFMSGSIEYAVYTIEHGKNVIWPPSAPTKAEYSFLGWDLDGNLFNGGAYPVTQNLTFTASWALLEHTVSFYNAATEVYTYERIKHGSKLQLPQHSMNGGLFKGWKLSGSPGRLYLTGEMYTVLSDLKFEAFWEADFPADYLDEENARIANWGIIKNADDLAGMLADGSYILMDDIDLSATEWTPILNFSGKFYGNGYVIRNLRITGTSAYSIGFFGQLSGSVKRVVLKDVLINVADALHVGGIAGELTSGGRISESSVAGSINAIYDYYDVYVGAIVGGMYDSVVESSYSEGTVVSNSQAGIPYVGGIVGNTDGASIVNSYSKASIVANSAYISYAGGIVGALYDSLLENVYSSGLVAGDGIVDACTGGIAGFVYDNAGIYNSVASNTSISAANGEGGRISGNYGGMLENNYAIDSIPPMSIGDDVSYGRDGESVIEAELKTESFYWGIGWDFEDTDGVWRIEQGSYPHLYWER